MLVHCSFPRTLSIPQNSLKRHKKQSNSLRKECLNTLKMSIVKNFLTSQPSTLKTLAEQDFFVYRHFNSNFHEIFVYSKRFFCLCVKIFYIDILYLSKQAP